MASLYHVGDRAVSIEEEIFSREKTKREERKSLNILEPAIHESPRTTVAVALSQSR